MANYEETKARMMRQYPTLFPSEAQVWHHLFFVIGNGYEWDGGELIACRERSDEEVFRDRARRHLSMYKRAEEFDDSMAALLDHEDPEVAAIAVRAKRRAEATHKVRSLAKRKGLAMAGRWLTEQEAKDARPEPETLYPLCEYARILHVPDDVKPDWLDAAKRALAWAMSDEVKREISDARYLGQARRLIKRIERQRAAGKVAN
jgi:hypothetical protein